jgi:hypothetical protein
LAFSKRTAELLRRKRLNRRGNLVIAALKYATIFGAAGGLATVYLLNGWWPLALLIGAVGLSWGIGSWRGWRWPADAGLLLLALAAGSGLWLGMDVWESFLAVVLTLSAWDLDHFHRQLRGVPRTAATARLERGHLLRLLVVSGISAAVVGVATAFRLQIGTGLAALLGAAVVCAVGEAIAFFRRESD